jgi:hypothetical protein
MRSLRWARREAAPFVAFVAGVALVVGILRGGAHYFYCPYMDVIVLEHCCESAPPSDAPSIEAPDCCQEKTLGEVPSAAGPAPAPAVLSAVIVASLPAPGAGDAEGGASLRLRPRFDVEHTGPPPLGSAREARARLMVFLI